MLNPPTHGWAPRLLALGLLMASPGCQNGATTADQPEDRETVAFAMKVPSAGWSIEPVEAWQTPEAIYCVFQLFPPEGPAAQVITEIESRLQLPRSSQPKRIVVLGKTWNWSSEDAIAFPESRDAFLQTLPKTASPVEIHVEAF